MRHLFSDTPERLIEKTAQIITDCANKLLQNSEKIVLAVPGGRSVAGVFERLRTKNIPWSRVHFFMVDERLVPLDDPGSNFRLVKEHLLDYLAASAGLPERNIHPFIMNRNRTDLGLADYAAQLTQLGGCYDIVLLSAGGDGHVAGLFPGHHSVGNDAEFYLTMTDSPKPPPGRMTSSRKLISRSRVGILLFFGETKQAAYELFESGSTVSECPASLVKFISESYIMKG